MITLTDAMRALGADDLDLAHRRVQDLEGPDAAWLHAHLHRAEGDMSNAAYWYRRAGREMPDASLADERADLMSRFGP